MTGIIYVTRNLINGKLYVGLHTGGRKDYLGSGSYLQKGIKKYGRKNFTRTDLDTFLEIAEGQAKERRWIAALNSKAPAGYNLNDGGEGGLNPSEETRAKMRAAKMGHSVNETTRAKVSAALKGNKYALGLRRTEETKAKMSMAHKGKHFSAEHRAKLSAAQKMRTL